MSDGVDQNSSVVDTASGGVQFAAETAPADPFAPAVSETKRPDHIPEKFWDTVKGEVRLEEMAKSYSELEKKIGQPKDEAAPEEQPEAEGEEKPEGEPEEQPEGETEEKPEGEPQAAVQAAITDAQRVYAETGELAEEARKPLLDLGIPNELIDAHIEASRIQTQALHQASYEAAGSQEALEAAMAWAAESWPAKQITAFNAQMSDMDSVKIAVPVLMAAYAKANPGEGVLTNVNTGVSRGEVYSSMEEFGQELKKADEARDPVARKKAIEKLARSQKSGTLKSSGGRRR